jgi:hypothetical protein
LIKPFFCTSRIYWEYERCPVNMAEDSGNFPTKNPSKSNGGSGASNAPGKSTATSLPSGFHPVRRAMTVDEPAQLRPQPSSNQPSFDRSFDSASRRRGSTFSEYSLNEARRNLQDDILNPSGVDAENHAASNWALLPLAFALLPAVGGLFFKNGSLLITDVMLLFLAAVFLQWSITQPWFELLIPNYSVTVLTDYSGSGITQPRRCV